ncbi:MAG: hypothetical protein M3R65_04085 [Gemmatimonadota bacterium]|nr:hypothetical protein [Gemmatimonadota bacterium]
MTDSTTNSAKGRGRVDFRAISDDPDFANVDRVMAAVFTKTSARFGSSEPFRRGIFGVIVGHAGALAAAAAILITASLTTLAVLPRKPAPAPGQTLAKWVQSNHVPTNGELLSTFEGYGR